MAITSRQTGTLAAEDWKKVYQTFRDADFTAYDFETLRKTMIDYIKLNYAEDFNDFTESSEFVALIDLIAFLGQSLAFRADLNARENFIDTAERRDSILKLARLISYNPKRTISASGMMKIDSVSTTETIYDSDGINLSNQIVAWNDPSNQNWYEQFVTVINAILQNQQSFGRPAHSQTINNIRTDEYGINLVQNVLPIYRFDNVVNGQNMQFEVVSATSVGKNYVYERDPDINQPFNILFRNDKNGNSSNNTGFFFYFKQGTLNNLDFTIDEMLANKIVNIDVNNINNSDVWLYSLDNFNRLNEKWEQVPATAGINVIYNSRQERNLYQVNSRANDQIALVFGDGTFSNIPQGTFRIFYRTSNGSTYKITPDELTGIDVSFDYVSKNNRVETVTFRASLRYTVANANARESASEIKQRAPQQYYTQNRMVTGEDYNIFPYTAYENIKKVKAINRTSSGLSRYLDILDTTGKYSSTNTFGQDGVLYADKSTETINFSFTNDLEVRKFIFNRLIPDIIDNKDVMHLYYENPNYRLLESPWVYERDFIDGEFYEITATGNTDFVQYGSLNNTVGTIFRSSKTGNRTTEVFVSNVGLDTFRLSGDVTGANPNINAKVGDTIIFNVDFSRDALHIKSTNINGVAGNVTVGRVFNNGASTGEIRWDTTGVPAGTYYYVSRQYGGSCYDINNFTDQYRGTYSFDVYRSRAQAIMTLYTSNSTYVLPSGQVRYGLFQYPDHGGLAYWTTSSLVQNQSPTSQAFYSIFFAAADAVPGFTRHLTANKSFDATSASNCGFRDQPSGWDSSGMSGKIIIRNFGNGQAKTVLKWQAGNNTNNTSTGYFSYNGDPVAIGNSITNQYAAMVPGTIVKFVPVHGMHYDGALNMIPGPAAGINDKEEIFASVQKIFGDGTNNGVGNFSNGIGPVTINLPIPSGSQVEVIVPAYKNALTDSLVQDIFTSIRSYNNFGLYYNSVALKWQMIPPGEIVGNNSWLVRFDYDITNKTYSVRYKTLKYVFHSPQETNFFFNPDQLVYDNTTNTVIEDNIKILRSNGMPDFVNQPLVDDLEWKIYRDMRRSDGYIENRSIYLTYADTNQDSIPDMPNLFDQVVLGGPFRTTNSGMLAQRYAVTINYEFKAAVGRYPTQVELDNAINSVISGELSLTAVLGRFTELPEAILFRNGVTTAQELVFFERTNDEYNTYKLLDRDKVITYYNTQVKLREDIKIYPVGQLFYCREDNQFYQILIDRFGKKFLSDGLNSSLSNTLPRYRVSVGRQNLYYQYRHNADTTHRIDPSISNIVDLYVLTAEYDSAYRIWVADSTGRIAEPETPTNLELSARYTNLENFKSVSDTLVLHSAVYKPLFGQKAAGVLQATFKVVKNPTYSISDADIKTSVISAINEYFLLENWDFGDSFYFTELAAYLHKNLSPTIASIAIVSKNLNTSFGSLYQINSEPYEILISAATVDDVEIVSTMTSLEFQPI